MIMLIFVLNQSNCLHSLYWQNERSLLTEIHEIEEGVSYQPAVSAFGYTTNDDIIDIPSPPCAPDSPKSDYRHEDIVVFDVETTGLGLFRIYVNIFLSI